MKRLKNIVLIAVAVVAGLAYLMPAPSVNAQSSASLSISPKKSYTIEPGKSINDTLVIRNLDNEKALELNLRVVDFSFIDDTGAPRLYLAEDAPQTTWSLKPFLSLPKTVSIPPRESKTINMSVAIPAGHGAGSYYSAILYSSGAPDGGNVGLSASGVTLVFTTIPGTVTENLKLEKFGVYQQARQGSNASYKFFNVDEPKTMAFTLKNEGNVTANPAGSITLRDIFGNERTIQNINPNSSLALIGQTRTFTTCIKQASQDVDFNGSRAESQSCTSPGLWPGIYTASIDIFYGQNGNRTQEVKGSAIFLYTPVWFLILLLVLALVIAYFVRRIILWNRARKTGKHTASSSKKWMRRR